MITEGIATSNGYGDTVPLARYLWERIHQVGVNHIFGLPGDFNLHLLDYIYQVEGLEWVGNTNELNAAYAADGYARVKHGAGCIVTTYGVGELSALNGVVGALAERVKVIHVVGQTTTRQQRDRVMIHHSTGFDPDHQAYNNATREFRCAAAEIQSAADAAEQIDDALRQCFIKSEPVYVFVPMDLVHEPVSAKPLQTPINLEPDVDLEAVSSAARSVLEALSNSQNPCVMVDCLVDRHGAAAEAKALVDTLGLPVYTTGLGKGIIDETHEHYVGLYNGGPSRPGIQDAFEAHDFILALGDFPTDANCGGWTRTLPDKIAAHINPHDVVIHGCKSTDSVSIKACLTSLIKLSGSYKIPKCQTPKQNLPAPCCGGDENSEMIRHSWIWKRFGEWLKPHDVLIGETGTSAFGLPDSDFPSDIQWFTQAYYASIGYATAAAFGADLALADQAAKQTRPRGRTVLVTGDGSMMLTVQEVGNMIKQNLCPIIFVINNSGYTIERIIHGATATYNDIVPFNYSHMLQFLNMPEDLAKSSFHRAVTRAELETILCKESVKNPERVQLVEVVMSAMDTPWRLSTQLSSRGPEAVKEMREAGFAFREMKKWDTKC